MREREEELRNQSERADVFYAALAFYRLDYGFTPMWL
jgi:hypothetical protein